MRYPAEHKARTRRRMVEGAAAALRGRGLDVGVAELMREAGLTHGGFYAHFSSKEALLAEAVELAGQQSVRNLRKIIACAGSRPALAAIGDAYLSTAHRDRPERGCALAAVGTELARESPAARRALTVQVRNLLNVLAECAPEQRARERQQRAIATLSHLVGALILSRIVDDRRASDEILATARRQVARGSWTRRSEAPVSVTERRERRDHRGTARSITAII